MAEYILALDQGTTSSRAILFGSDMAMLNVEHEEFVQHFPNDGWVEHDPMEILSTTISSARKAIKSIGAEATSIAAIGITNQRETTVVWDKESGKPIYNAIVWQDRRTADFCENMKRSGIEKIIADKTGLLLDPYFSASKIAWILDNVSGARERANAGKLLFGTIDSWLIWNLTGGKVHATDATNASRTSLYNIVDGCWDEELLKIFNVPINMLPSVKDCAADYGATDAKILGAAISIRGVAGDQQAATVGQACFKPGMMKSTYGTGCFVVLNTGEKPVLSKNRLLTTIAYQINGIPIYALEGSIFVAGAAVQWMRDGLGIIDNAAQSEKFAKMADKNQSVYLVPAFTGIGAPHWDANARGAIYGITRATGPYEIARAALESVGYQTRDLMEAMKKDYPAMGDVTLRVDGGMSASNWTMQFLADILNAPVDRPRIIETTALGAAYLAGMDAGIYPNMDEFSGGWKAETRFVPQMKNEVREEKYSGWLQALGRTLVG
ncbi:MAG: glycerol kinase GlpK [Rhodospirillaceae bacterium]|nr:glycerol kinase GlpK [Rhodospirillaceae bacterium]